MNGMKDSLKKSLSKIKALSKKRIAIITVSMLFIISASVTGIYLFTAPEDSPTNQVSSNDVSAEAEQKDTSTIKNENSSPSTNASSNSVKEWSASDVRCSICGEKISDSNKEHLGFNTGDATTAHSECMAKQLYGDDVFDRCLWCNEIVTDGYHVVQHIPWIYGDRVAHDYCWFAYCSVCGKQVERNLNSDNLELPMKDGMCYDCYNASQIIESPNVTCPACNYSWFTTGVGIEGFFCPSCGVNFNGNGEIIK